MPASNVMRGAFSFNLIVLVLVQLAPLAGVYFLGWKSFDILMLFWAENLVIGLFVIAKMLVRLFAARDVPVVVLAPFFTVHYGAFCLGHGLMLLSWFGPPHLKPPPNVPELIDFVWPLVRAVQQIPGLAWSLALLAAGQFVAFVAVYLFQGGFRATTAQRLMGEPYPRIVMLHVAMIFGAAIARKFGDPFIAVVLLILFKAGGEVAIYLRNARRAGGAMRTSFV
jgi:hypothetical protein